VPLIVPLTLLQHHLRRQPVPDWVRQQVYLNPYPKELLLRNHVWVDKSGKLMYNIIDIVTVQVLAAMKTLRALVIVLSNLSLTLIIGEGP
jgi:hypothetical protein